MVLHQIIWSQHSQQFKNRHFADRYSKVDFSY